MKILVVNAGSSSVKFTVYQMETETVLAKGLVERIGLKEPNFVYERPGHDKEEKVVAVANHTDALKAICEKLVDTDHGGVLESLSDIDAIGHRVVHGGEKFSEPVLIDSDVKNTIRLCANLAPLHNPPNLDGIEACEKAFPGTQNVAVFDTAFHQTMPPEAFMYAIPRELYEDHGIRKYGFHGTSHKFVTNAAADYLGKPVDELKLISCHLGNGSSIAAVKYGKVIDTSMGMTPLCGLVMGTRSGDIDPAIIFYLKKKGYAAGEIDSILNKKSGLLGVGGIKSGDMRDIVDAAANGVETARIALDLWAHRLAFYVGGYYTLLSGADAVIITGGIGENSVPARAAFLSRLSGIGCHMDRAAIQITKKAVTLSTPDSELRAIVLPTDEELMIGRETALLLK
ncbi:MAG: acetate kinase [Lentisphaeria bacterium]|nr:acetate kinase [Lentisphaeria bacterium]